MILDLTFSSCGRDLFAGWYSGRTPKTEDQETTICVGFCDPENRINGESWCL